MISGCVNEVVSDDVGHRGKDGRTEEVINGGRVECGSLKIQLDEDESGVAAK